MISILLINLVISLIINNHKKNTSNIESNKKFIFRQFFFKSLRSHKVSNHVYGQLRTGIGKRPGIGVWSPGLWTTLPGRLSRRLGLGQKIVGKMIRDITLLTFSYINSGGNSFVNQLLFMRNCLFSFESEYHIIFRKNRIICSSHF